MISSTIRGQKRRAPPYSVSTKSAYRARPNQAQNRQPFDVWQCTTRCRVLRYEPPNFTTNHRIIRAISVYMSAMRHAYACLLREAGCLRRRRREVWAICASAYRKICASAYRRRQRTKVKLNYAFVGTTIMSH